MKYGWKSNEIEILKKCFLKEKSLKEMGRLLGRSATAVNKALTRFKIREYKINKESKL